MKKALNVAIIIFTPIIVSLLLRLAIGILNFVFDIVFDWTIDVSFLFGFDDMWWFWLIAAILSLVGIFILLAWANENIDD